MILEHWDYFEKSSEPICFHETICSCCGSITRLSKESAWDVDGGIGITVWPSSTPSNEETEQYWDESIAVGDAWLVVRHLKHDPYYEPESDDEYYDDEPW